MLNRSTTSTSEHAGQPGWIMPIGTIQHDTGCPSCVEPPMKKCFKCGVSKPLSEFYRHPAMSDGHLGKCKECAKRDVAKHRLANLRKVHKYDCERAKRPERQAQVRVCARKRQRLHPEKTRAYDMVRRAIRLGRLVRKPCEVCGAAKVEAHHDDYLKPLDVRWLCFKHHREAHGQIVTAF